jgi:single-strand DNA-binding protein
MIRALIVGKLWSSPEQRTSKAGKPFAFARLSVPMGEGYVQCSVIAFRAEAVERLMQLREGASICASGTLTVKTFTTSAGEIRPSLDLLVDEISSTTPRPKRDSRNADADNRNTDADLDWLGA